MYDLYHNHQTFASIIHEGWSSQVSYCYYGFVGDASWHWLSLEHGFILIADVELTGHNGEGKGWSLQSDIHTNLMLSANFTFTSSLSRNLSREIKEQCSHFSLSDQLRVQSDDLMNYHQPQWCIVAQVSD
jgi:hypothetical protein